MLKLRTIAVIAILVCSTVDANAHKATEIFIPIGQSPGLSDKYTVIGKIDAIRVHDQTITLMDSKGSHVFKVTERTNIWLDRSQLKWTNRKGAFEDLQTGRLVEVKYEHSKQGHADAAERIAEWIKVQADR